MAADYKLHTTAGRAKLTPRRDPYWFRLEQGRFVGLHVSNLGRHYWRARFYVPAQQDYVYESFDECVPGVFDFDQAVIAARAWFEEQAFRLYGRRSHRGAYTVGDAVRDHLKRQLAAMDANVDPHRRTAATRLFERIVLGNAPDPITGRYRRGQSAYEVDPIEAVAMTERALTADVINQWLLRLKTRGAINGRKAKKTATVNQEYKQLRAALNAAVDAQLAPAAVARAWKCELNKPFKVNTSDQRRYGYLTPAQVQAWIGELEQTPADILRLQYLTGARPGLEMNTLTRASFDDKHNTLTIREGKTKYRVIALSDPARALLMRLSKDKLPGAFLFLGPNGNPVDCYTFRNIFKAAAINAGLPASTVPYCLRHSFITDGLTAGIPETPLATHCGTSVMMFRKHYFHLLTRGLADQLTMIQTRDHRAA